MNRRHMLEWLCRGLKLSVTAIIGLPGLQYILGSIQPAAREQAQFQRLKRLQDLPVGRPLLVPVLGSKQDGWTRSTQQVIGRVWLVRSSAGDTTAVNVYSSICPHMGCQVQAQASNQGFVCPCHRASFDLNGSRQDGEKTPSPRDLDGLECRVIPDASTGENWVEVKYEKFVTGLEKSVARA